MAIVAMAQDFFYVLGDSATFLSNYGLKYLQGQEEHAKVFACKGDI